MRSELRDSRLLCDQLGPLDRQLLALRRHALLVRLERLLPRGELVAGPLELRCELLELGLAQCQLTAGGELALVCLDVVLQRLLQTLLSAERLLQLDADVDRRRLRLGLRGRRYLDE